MVECLVPAEVGELFQRAVPDPSVQLQAVGGAGTATGEALTAIVFGVTFGCTWR